jgi:hypothetical protein
LGIDFQAAIAHMRDGGLLLVRADLPALKI